MNMRKLIGYAELVLKFCIGLSVAYLSGRHSSDGQQFGTYSQDDVDALRAIAEEPGVIDLFVTYPSILSTKLLFSNLFRVQLFMLLCTYFVMCLAFMTSLIDYH